MSWSPFPPMLGVGKGDGGGDGMIGGVGRGGEVVVVGVSKATHFSNKLLKARKGRKISDTTTAMSPRGSQEAAKKHVLIEYNTTL